MYKKAIKKTTKRTERTYYVGCYVSKRIADAIHAEQKNGRKITDIANSAFDMYFGFADADLIKATTNLD